MAAAQACIHLPGLMVVAGRDEDELSRPCGDDSDITENAPLERVEPGLIDARGALRVVVPSGLDVLPAHGARRNGGDVEPDVLLAKIRTIPGSEGEVAVCSPGGHAAGQVRGWRARIAYRRGSGQRVQGGCRAGDNLRDSIPVHPS